VIVNDEYSRVAATLCWACTGRMAPQECAEDLLLAAMATHRVASRFLARVAESGTGFSERFIGEVRKIEAAQLKAADAVEQDANWLADVITRHPRWDRMPFVIVKGNAASHLTHVKWSRRATADIDLLTSDPVLYQEILESAGYLIRGDNFGGHEAANLYSADHCDVDLHRYCPSWRVPDRSYSRWTSNGDELHMTDWIRCEPLGYDLVLDGSVSHPAVSSAWSRMPDATTSMLIICLEVFRDYVANNQDMATIRLSDLCEVVELRNCEEFDEARLAQLVRQCRARDSVALTSHLVDQLFGRTDYLGLGLTDPVRVPQMIGIGQLFDTGPRLSDLLLRRDNFGHSLSHMMPNELASRDLPSTIEVRAASVAVNGQPARAVRSVPPAHLGDGAVEFDCTMSMTGEGVAVDIHGLWPPGPFREVVKIVLRHGTIVTSYDGYCSGFRYPSPALGCSAVWQLGSDGWKVRVEIPSTLLSTGRAPVTVPVIVHCCRFLEPPTDSWDLYYRKVVSSVSVPVLLTFER
jgi:hypothetical protein